MSSRGTGVPSIFHSLAFLRFAFGIDREVELLPADELAVRDSWPRRRR